MLKFYLDRDKLRANFDKPLVGGFVIFPENSNQTYKFTGQDYPGSDQLVNLSTFNSVDDAVKACQNYYDSMLVGLMDYTDPNCLKNAKSKIYRGLGGAVSG